MRMTALHAPNGNAIKAVQSQKCVINQINPTEEIGHYPYLLGGTTANTNPHND
jgi:hypothetical protein